MAAMQPMPCGGDGLSIDGIGAVACRKDAGNIRAASVAKAQIPDVVHVELPAKDFCIRAMADRDENARTFQRAGFSRRHILEVHAGYLIGGDIEHFFDKLNSTPAESCDSRGCARP